MLKTILAICLSMVGLITQAAEIKFYLPFPAGGGGAHFGNMVQQDLTQSGYKIDFKTINNCAQVKDIFLQTRDPILTVWLNDFNRDADSPCFMEPSLDHFVNILYSSPKFLCMRDGFTPDRRLKIAITQAENPKIIREGISALTSWSVSVVQYPNSNGVKTALLNKEVDGVFSSHGRQLEHEKTANCLWSTAEHDIDHIKSVGKKSILANQSLIMYVLARNIPHGDLLDLRRHIQTSIESNRYQSSIRSRFLSTNVQNVYDQFAIVSGKQ